MANKKTVLILSNEFWEAQSFPCLPPKSNSGYKGPRDIPKSPARYFNYRLMNFNQYFASDVDYIFFARSVHDQRHLRLSINLDMTKIKPVTLTAGMVTNTLKGTIEKFVASDNAFSFLSSVKGTPAYWKRFSYDVLAMVKQLGIPTYFLTLSYADLRWEELPYIIINKLNNLGFSDEELKNLSHQELCNLLNYNPVLVTWWSIGKNKILWYTYWISRKGSQHVCWFIWIFNAPNIQNETAYTDFTEKTINAQLPDHLKGPELFELGETYQIHAHSRTGWEYSKN